MKKLNNIKLKKLVTSLVLDAIQIAMLLGLLVYTQVLALHAMIAYFPSACHKRDVGTFIALFLVGTLCATMLWIILLFIDKYKVMMFGEQFPSFWKKNRLPSVSKMPPPPTPRHLEENDKYGKIEWHSFHDPACVSNLPVVAFVFMPKHRKCICLCYPNSLMMNKAEADSVGYYVFVAWAKMEDLEASALSVGWVRRTVEQCEGHLPQDIKDDYFKNIWDHGM